MTTSIVITIITAVIGSGAVFGFIQFLIQRKDNDLIKRFDKLDEKIDKLEKNFDAKIDSLKKDIEDIEANNARVRILKFSEEVQHGQKHSKESYDQIHKDIDDYTRHCNKYPDYPNSRADAAIKNIERLYLEALKLEEAGNEGFLQ